jgi:hypothetical protein
MISAKNSVKSLPKSPKNCKMEFKKPLSEHQKRSLSNAITALNIRYLPLVLVTN